MAGRRPKRTGSSACGRPPLWGVFPRNDSPSADPTAAAPHGANRWRFPGRRRTVRMNERADCVLRAAEAGGSVALESFRAGVAVETKDGKTDVVTQADRDAQRRITATIREAYPTTPSSARRTRRPRPSPMRDRVRREGFPNRRRDPPLGVAVSLCHHVGFARLRLDGDVAPERLQRDGPPCLGRAQRTVGSLAHTDGPGAARKATPVRRRRRRSSFIPESLCEGRRPREAVFRMRSRRTRRRSRYPSRLPSVVGSPCEGRDLNPRTSTGADLESAAVSRLGYPRTC